MREYIQKVNKTVRLYSDDLNTLVILNLNNIVNDDYCDYVDLLESNYNFLKNLTLINSLDCEYLEGKISSLEEILKHTKEGNTYALLEATLNYILGYDLEPTVQLSEGDFSVLESAMLEVLNNSCELDHSALYGMLDSIMLSSDIIKSYTVEGLKELLNKIDKNKEVYAKTEVIEALDVCIELCSPSNVTSYELMMSLEGEFTDSEIKVEKEKYIEAQKVVNRALSVQDDLRSKIIRGV